MHPRARLSRCPGKAGIFLLVFSTLQSCLTVFPNWVNTAPVHTSINRFLLPPQGSWRKLSGHGQAVCLPSLWPVSWASAEGLRGNREAPETLSPHLHLCRCGSLPPHLLLPACWRPTGPLRLVLDPLPPSARGGRGPWTSKLREDTRRWL